MYSTPFSVAVINFELRAMQGQFTDRVYILEKAEYAFKLQFKHSLRWKSRVLFMNAITRAPNLSIAIDLLKVGSSPVNSKKSAFYRTFIILFLFFILKCNFVKDAMSIYLMLI